jgi:hypothetical protein
VNDHARLISLVWQSISDFIPMNARDDAAHALIRAYMDGEDVEATEFYDLSGDCQHLDAALETLDESEEDHSYDVDDELDF